MLNAFMTLTSDCSLSFLYSCFISDPAVFFSTFLGPIFVILLFNVVIFIMVIGVLIKHSLNTRSRTAEQVNKKKTAMKLLISMTGIMFLFGLTWLFGGLTVTGLRNSNASAAFQVIFVLLNAFQGFFIFLFFCVFSKDARQSWLELLCCGHYKSKLRHPLQAKYGANTTQRKSKTTTTNLANPNRTSAIPHKSDTSGYNVSTTSHSKEKSYTNVPLTSLHAEDQGKEKPSMDDLSKEEKDTDIPHTSAPEQAEMEKLPIIALKEHSEVHETTDEKVHLGSPEVKEKEKLLERSDSSEKHISHLQWRDDGLELKARVKRYSTRKRHFQSAEVDFFNSDSDSSDEPGDANA